jgi:hypothetical protein
MNRAVLQFEFMFFPKLCAGTGTGCPAHLKNDGAV